MALIFSWSGKRGLGRQSREWGGNPYRLAHVSFHVPEGRGFRSILISSHWVTIGRRVETHIGGKKKIKQKLIK